MNLCQSMEEATRIVDQALRPQIRSMVNDRQIRSMVQQGPPGLENRFTAAEANLFAELTGIPHEDLGVGTAPAEDIRYKAPPEGIPLRTQDVAAQSVPVTPVKSFPMKSPPAKKDKAPAPPPTQQQPQYDDGKRQIPKEGIDPWSNPEEHNKPWPVVDGIAKPPDTWTEPKPVHVQTQPAVQQGIPLPATPMHFQQQHMGYSCTTTASSCADRTTGRHECYHE